MKRLWQLPAAIVAAFALSPALAGDTQEGGLSWRFSKGEKVRYAYSYDVSRATELMGMPMNQSQKLTLHFGEEVKEAGPEGYTIETTIERLMLKLDMGPMGGGVMEYDTKDAKKEAPKKDAKKKSEDEDEDEDGEAPGLDALATLVGEKFTFKLGKDGNVSELTGLDAIMNKLKDKAGTPRMPRGMGMGGDPAKLMKAIAVPLAMSLMTPDVVKQTLELHCHVLPKDGAAAEKWELETSQVIPATGEIQFKRTFTVKGEAEGAGQKGVKIQHSSTEPKFKPLKIPAGAAGDPMSQAAAAMSSKQKMKEAGYEGHTIWSKEKGRILSDELVETVTTESTMKNPFGPAKKKKKAAEDEDEDEDKPAKKDEKKSTEKKGDDEEGGEDEGMRIVQKFKVTLGYQLLEGAADETPVEKKPEEKKPADKKDGSF